MTKAYLERFGLRQNVKVIARWLDDAKYYVSNYRPVPIEEYLVYENSIYPAANPKEFFRTASQLCSGQSQRLINASRIIEPSILKELVSPITNAVVSLALETVRAGYGALVFCSSRQGCQTNALLISEAMQDADAIDSAILHKRMDVLANLRSLPADLDPTFQKTIIRGVAFHRKY